MTPATVYGLYTLTILLCLLPLLSILMRRRFQTYAVYFVFVTGFLVFNVVGSITANVMRVATPAFYALNLVVACGLLLLYPLLMAMGAEVTRRGGLRALQAPRAAEMAGYRRFCWALMAAGVGGALAFYAGFSRPLILRFDLFGNMPELMRMRTDIVMKNPMFAWFALLFFEFPAIAVITASLLRGQSLNDGDRAEASRWTGFLWVAAPLAMALSVAYFHASVLVNLLAAMALVALFVRGRLPLGLIARYGVPALLGIVLMYMGKQGFKLTGESLGQLSTVVGHRLFEVYAWGAAVVLYIFPRQQSFLHGTSFINFFGLFHYEQVNLSTFVYPYIYSDTNGSSPVPAVVEGFANFGWVGALGILGVLLLLITGITLLSWSQRPFDQAMAVYLTIRGITVWQVALWFGLMDLTLIFMLPWVWLAYRLLVPRPGRSFAPLHPLPAAGD